MHASFGFHPYEVISHSEKEIEQYIEKIKAAKQQASAIGEIGLDFFLIKDPEQQKRCKDIFVQFIEFSKELKLPIVIHCRDAHHETIDILSNQDARQVVFHYFGAKDFTKQIMEEGWHVSLPVTVAMRKSFKDVLREIQEDRLMVETDSPVKISGEKLILPTDVRYVIERIADEKKTSFQEVEKLTDQNTADFFSLKLSAKD